MVVICNSKIPESGDLRYNDVINRILVRKS